MQAHFRLSPLAPETKNWIETTGSCPFMVRQNLGTLNRFWFCPRFAPVMYLLFEVANGPRCRSISIAKTENLQEHAGVNYEAHKVVAGLDIFEPP